MKRSRGFTLIELLVVIAIIGLLSSVVVASLNTARAKARDAQRLSDLHQIKTALELYYSTNNSYPSGGYNSECAAWGSLSSSNVIPGLVPTYMAKFPSDPAMVVASNQNCYIYIGNGANYKLLLYNLVDSPNPGGPQSVVDPYRNYNQSYPRPAGCSGTEITRTWAIYSPAAACLW